MKNKPNTFIEEIQLDTFAFGKVAELERVIVRVSDNPVMLQSMKDKVSELLKKIEQKQKVLAKPKSFALKS